MKNKIKKNIYLSQAVIFCGGPGSRLGNITKNKSKPLLKVNNTYFILHLLKNLSRFGIKHVILLCHYKYADYKKIFKNRIYFGIKVECIYEKKLLGSAGALDNAKKYLHKIFLICNGDTYFDFNLMDLYKQFDSKKKLGIVALTKLKFFPNRYGVINKNKLGLIDFSKKLNKKNFLINTGVAILKKKIIKYIILNSKLENETFFKISSKNLLQAAVYKNKFNKFIDIGIKKDFYNASNFLKIAQKKSAIFFDRDGIINIDTGYVHRIDHFIWRNGIAKLIKYFNDNNYYVFVVTNQSGVGRGFYKEKDVIYLHNWINQQLQKAGAYVDDFFYAPYFKFSKNKIYQKNSSLRKPKVGMFLQAKKKWDININGSYVVGDKLSDIEFAKSCKLKGILINEQDDIYKKVKKVVINKN
jgi:D-glycero-D-manno-heptose 1,7-bisphosphate phosphatase